MSSLQLSETERLRLADTVFNTIVRYFEPRIQAVEKKIEQLEALVRQSGGLVDVPMISQSDLARQLRISVRTFRRWRKQGYIGGRKIKGRRGLWFTSAEAQEIRKLIAQGGIKRPEADHDPSRIHPEHTSGCTRRNG